MLMLVTSDNLLQMFFGWEGVGLASYLLIGFWYKKPSANAAAMKAFVVNRVGDFGFALGIFGTVRAVRLDPRSMPSSPVPPGAGRQDHDLPRLGSGRDDLTICLLLFMGAMGKSAQFLLHTWLPDAMEGPTPVSALIHAATMVTAGVFLVARMSPLFELSPTALVVVTVSARSRRSSPRPSAWCRTTSSASSPIRPVRSSATCSSRLASAPMASPSSTCSPTPSSRRCCSSAPARSSTPCRRAGHAQHGRPAQEDPDDLLDDDDRHAGADRCRHSRHLRHRRLLLQGHHHRVAYAAHNGGAGFAFWLLVIAALFTSFYSWRLIFMTFHGKPRASRDVMQPRA
jgi:NADH-quinone oxidoreductase subunit L